jgi:hypothetical protein
MVTILCEKCNPTGSDYKFQESCTDCKVMAICMYISDCYGLENAQLSFVKIFYSKIEDPQMIILLGDNPIEMTKLAVDKLRELDDLAEKHRNRTESPEQLVSAMRSIFKMCAVMTHKQKKEHLKVIKKISPQYKKLFNSKPGYYENLILSP